MLTREEIDAIRRRLDAATPGRWVAYVEGRDHESGSSFIMTGVGGQRGPDIEMSGATVADYDFIAASRQDVAALLAEVEELRVAGQPEVDS
jgi:hypothetical protein